MTNGSEDGNEAGYLDVLVESAVETLRTMAMLEASCVRRCEEAECDLCWDVGADMELAGSAGGWIGIAAEMNCARKIVGRIVGEDAAEVTEDDAAGGLGEVLNMIAGSAKTRLMGTRYHFELTIPVPWTEKGRSAGGAAGNGTAAIFDVEGMPFAVCARIG